MALSRIDLDGAGSPLGLVARILKLEPDIKIPVPIEDLASCLDIGEIAEVETDSFEGGLVTDQMKSVGGILIRKGMDRRRRRFTIGHELGHFLLPFHTPAKPGEFLCSRKDMQRWNATTNSAARMEVEANQFAAAILIPAPHLRGLLAKSGDPDLAWVLRIHQEFDVSKETAARAYSQYQGESIAIIIAKDGAVVRSYRSPTFPQMCVKNGHEVPRKSSWGSLQSVAGQRISLRPTHPELWLESDWGKRLPDLYEQVLFQQGGFAMILLWAGTGLEDDYDPDEDKTSKQRLADRIHRSGR